MPLSTTSLFLVKLRINTSFLLNKISTKKSLHFRARGPGGAKFVSWWGRESGREPGPRSGAWYWPRQERELHLPQVHSTHTVSAFFMQKRSILAYQSRKEEHSFKILVFYVKKQHSFNCKCWVFGHHEHVALFGSEFIQKPGSGSGLNESESAMLLEVYS